MSVSTRVQKFILEIYLEGQLGVVGYHQTYKKMPKYLKGNYASFYPRWQYMRIFVARHTPVLEVARLNYILPTS